jgi:dTDP-4-dehydrorhamnose reductase
MKRSAEVIVQASGLNQAVIRLSLTFGWRQHRKQFNNYALRVLDRLHQADGILLAATNLFNTPIEITSAASAISQITLRRDVGIFHVASRDRLSRHEFARSVAEVFGFPVSRILPFEDTSGLRQPNSCLSVERTESVLSARFEKFRKGLARMKRKEAGF